MILFRFELGRWCFVWSALALCSACGGRANDGGAAPPSTCSKASINFRLRVAADSTTTYCAGVDNDLSCGMSHWLSIHNSAGAPFPLYAGSCTTSCHTCTEIACTSVCFEPVAIGADGVEHEFDGSYEVFDRCGGAATSCADSACAPPGEYVA